MALLFLLLGLCMTIGIGVYSARVTYMNLKNEDYEVDFDKLMSRPYLDLIKDKDRLARLLKVKLWGQAFTFVLIFYLAGSVVLALNYSN